MNVEMSTFWLCAVTTQHQNHFHMFGESCTLWVLAWREGESCSVVSHSLWPHGLQPPRHLCPRILEWVAMLSSRGSFQPRSPTSQVDSSPSEPQGKPKKTGVSSLSLLQVIFLAQELNCGLLHCRQIPYQLSYQGSSFSGIQDTSTHPRINQPHWHQV